MKNTLSKKQIERYSRQIVLKNIGAIGQQKILKSKVLIVGSGGLGCPVADALCRAGVGTIGIVDNDKVSLSNIHRQSFFTSKDVGKYKVKILKERIKLINPETKTIIFKEKITKLNIKKIFKNFDIIVDGSDNFKTKFLLNDYCLKYKKFLVTGAISKFDGHIFTFNFVDKNTPSLRDFYQEEVITDEILNCEYEGILGPVAGTIGTMLANEVLKQILKVGQNLNGFILIIDLLNLSFRKVKLNKTKKSENKKFN